METLETLRAGDERNTEETLSGAWDQHLASEFAAKSTEEALAMMTAEPYVNVVPYPTQPVNDLIRRANTDSRAEDNKDARLSPLQAAIIKPEQAQLIKAFGLDIKILLTTEATGGTISVLMGWHKPGEGPPDHVHFDQEEIFFILEGTYELTVDNQTTTVGPGTIVFIPRNVVHRFKNIGDTTACMLDWSLPGGQDHYFKAIAELTAGGFSGEKVMEINKKFNTNFLVAD